MSSLKYVGKPSSKDTDIVSRLQTTNLFTAANPNRTSASSDVVSSATPYATKTYVDGQDATFKLISYYQSQDLLNVPLTSVGQPNGVASLNLIGKLPAAQVPVVGSGYLRGPYSPTATFATSASSTPVKIADWNIGVQSLTFQPLAFGIFVVSGNGLGRPVIEVKMSSGSQAYGSQTLIGIGMGRSGYTDQQPIVVLPAPANTSQSGTAAGWSTSTNIWATAWLSDANGASAIIGAGGVASATIFLARLAQ